MNFVHRLAQWSIDEASLQSADKSAWELVAGQAMVPLGIAELWALWAVLGGLEWWHHLGFAVFTTYTCMPTIGAWSYLREWGKL